MSKKDQENAEKPLNHDDDFWTSTFTSVSTQPTPYEFYSHFCVDNLKNTFNPFVTTGAPLICLNEENHPFLMGIADGQSSPYYPRYDKIETAFEWMDGIISGTNMRQVPKNPYSNFVSRFNIAFETKYKSYPDFKRSCPIEIGQMNDFTDCRFYHDGSNTTVFETPSPYSNNVSCQNNITCSDSNETVHYQFEFFDIETNYDYFIISRNRTISFNLCMTRVEMVMGVNLRILAS